MIRLSRNWLFLILSALLGATPLAHGQPAGADSGQGSSAAAPVQAPALAPAPVVAPVVAPATFASADDAKAALDRVAAERSEVGARYASQERECLKKFFTTACLDAAKDQQRVALGRLRTTEVEAKAFLRRDRVARSDQALEQKRLDDEREAKLIEKEVLLREQAQERKKQDSEARLREAAQAPAVPAGPSARERKQDQRLKEWAAGEAQEQADRARNIADYEAKVKAAEENRRKVAQRKANKARERAIKAEQAAKAAQATEAAKQAREAKNAEANRP